MHALGRVAFVGVFISLQWRHYSLTKDMICDQQTSPEEGNKRACAAGIIDADIRRYAPTVRLLQTSVRTIYFYSRPPVDQRH